MVEEAPGNLLVDGIETERQVGRQHGGHALLGRIEGIGNGRLGALGLPLLGAGRAGGQFPLVFEQIFEEEIAPTGRRLRPSHFEARRDRVGAGAGGERALPAEALVFEIGPFRVSGDQRGIAGAVGLAEGVAARDQRHRLLVVHRHAPEGLADVASGSQRVRIAVRTFGVDVDQAHLHRAERLGQLALATIALVAEPGAFGTPEEFFGLPHVGSSAGETESLEAHRFKRNIAREDQQIGPGNPVAVFLLDRPEQAARLVQIGVVRPAVERGKALLPLAGAAATVGDAIGAGTVPGHADEEPAIVAEIGRPPLLRIGHQRGEVRLERLEIELLEGLGVDELGPQRIRQGRIAVEELQVDLLGPPIPVRSA